MSPTETALLTPPISVGGNTNPDPDPAQSVFDSADPYVQEVLWANATFAEIFNELQRAKRHGSQFHSLHEAYAVLLEEVDEVWEITLQKRKDRDPIQLRKELLQVAAMALKALQSLDNFVGGTV